MSKQLPITLRTLGDDSIQIGPTDSTAIGTKQPTNQTQTTVDQPVSSSSTDYAVTAFDSLVVPSGAGVIVLEIDRTNLLQVVDPDGFRVMAMLELSQDGGLTWGGAYLNGEIINGKQMNVCYSLAMTITTGEVEETKDTTVDMTMASMSLSVPPDLGKGVMVRPTVGATSLTDIGIQLSFLPSSVAPAAPFVPSVPHSVAYDSVAPGASGQGGNGVSSISWNHTNTGTTNLAIFAGIPWTSFPARTNITAITYNGIAMNLVANTQRNDFQGSLAADCSLYQLVNPSTGTKSFSVTWGAANAYFGGAGTVMYTGVNQTTPVVQHAVGSGTGFSSSDSLTSVVTGNMVINAMVREDSGDSSDTVNVTARTAGNGAGGQGGGIADTTSSGSVTVAWTFPSASSKWMDVIAEIGAAGAVAVTFVNWEDMPRPERVVHEILSY